MTANGKDSSMERELEGLKERMREMSLELRNISSILQCNNQVQGGNDLLMLLRGEARERTIAKLDSGMAKRCDMRKECRNKFSGFLDENLDMLEMPRITEDDIRSRADLLSALQTKATPGKCDGCFDQVGSLFQQQIDLMKALRLYQNRDEIRSNLDVLPEREVVKDLLEPLSNVQRLVIMKSLAKAPRSFSELSSLTNLRGGNLLFHLQRLSASDMISQRNGRGDYALTDRGTKALEMVTDLYRRIHR